MFFFTLDKRVCPSGYQNPAGAVAGERSFGVDGASVDHQTGMCWAAIGCRDSGTLERQYLVRIGGSRWEHHSSDDTQQGGTARHLLHFACLCFPNLSRRRRRSLDPRRFHPPSHGTRDHQQTSQRRTSLATSVSVSGQALDITFSTFTGIESSNCGSRSVWKRERRRPRSAARHEQPNDRSAQALPSCTPRRFGLLAEPGKSWSWRRALSMWTEDQVSPPQASRRPSMPPPLR